MAFNIFKINGFWVALPWLIVFAGIAILIFGIYLPPPEFAKGASGFNWKEVCTSIGKVTLASGIISFLLRAMQIMGMVREELTHIIYDTSYLEKRTDLHEIWDKVSHAMFKNKFPKIKSDITNDVKHTYLPTDHILYYDNFKQLLEINLINKENETIKVIQNTNFDVYYDLTESKFPYESTNRINFNLSEDEVSFKVNSFKINGKPVQYKVEQSTENNCLNSKVSVILYQKEEKYHFETVIVKTYSLKNDNLIAMCRNKMIHNCEIDVLLKGRLSIVFRSCGTLKEFITLKATDNDEEIYRKFTYNGMIYPKQGYMMFIKIKNK